MWWFQRLNGTIFSRLINLKSHHNHHHSYKFRKKYFLPKDTSYNNNKFYSLLITLNKMNAEDIKIIWKNADAVSFDVDSTVIQEEGIDELAKFCGKGDQVTELTKKAMQGNMTFQQSLTVRLNIIRPSLEQIKQFIKIHPPKLTPGIKELVDKLHEKNKKVFLISGGFRCLISPVATRLNISQDNIFANRLLFNFAGEFGGFDENELTAKSGGKAQVIKRLKDNYNFKTIVHIGDGATDLEACPPADAFVGFGGNVVRDTVKNGSRWFVYDLNQLKEALD
ncbi:GSCOCG00009941001-RA-CDS [Cotesia congregata]|uniref:Phosphoserine phosphatase n=1 Tax=Cotesia congregata TaxID=51543 RepID=A0A8J2MRQ0_COTCN|nr:GSCOCG00009941001-RA-CDS [Cotesia congregata]CAG5091005.1 Similar to PSPH: Phosphoserine phosphatase (Bos taurus) [Cotesia congregata]